jgi:UDP-glucose 6-dehydrogenase
MTETKNLYFTTDINRSVKEADIIYICVNTPPSKESSKINLGKATDMSCFYSVVKNIG